jgi:hypothetical protein
VAEIFPELDEYGYHKLPIIFAGDLNVNLKSNEGNEFIEYMQDRFGVKLNNDPSISIYIFMLQRCFTGGKILLYSFTYCYIRLHINLYMFQASSRSSSGGLKICKTTVSSQQLASSLCKQVE